VEQTRPAAKILKKKSRPISFMVDSFPFLKPVGASRVSPDIVFLRTIQHEHGYKKNMFSARPMQGRLVNRPYGWAALTQTRAGKNLE
jgi:hypothetical protein